MDEDYEISINSNMLSMKSPTSKYNNNNDTTLLNYNGLNPTTVATYKTSKNGTPTTINNSLIINNNNVNIMLSTNCNTTPNTILTHQNTNKYLNNILTNSRTMPNAMTINCLEADAMDTSTVKEEPLSPDSSCPPSPNASSLSSTSSSMGIVSDNTHTLIVTQQQQQPTINQTAAQFVNVNLANVAAYTNTDLVFEHNNKVSVRQ